MNNELIEQKSWWKRNWKWFVSLTGFILILITILFSSGFGRTLGDYSKAYADSSLYENALEKAQQNKRVIEVLGSLEPIDNLAILEGEVHYSKDNNSVKTSIRVKGTKGKARLDIFADRINDTWYYKIINIRIKSPPEKKETIEIIKQIE